MTHQGYRVDLTGKKFNHLTVLGYAGQMANGRKNSVWNTRCDCGREKIIEGRSLTSGNTKSCGCAEFKREFMKAALGKGIGQLTGATWSRLKGNARARGIKVTVTKQQVADLFEKQQGKCALSGLLLVLDAPVGQVTASLDRIDSDKGYEPGNVQWLHKEINWMKNTFSQTRFIELCKAVSNTV